MKSPRYKRRVRTTSKRSARTAAGQRRPGCFQRRISLEPLEDRRVLAAVIAGPFSGIVADVVNAVVSGTDTETTINDILTAAPNAGAYIAFPGEINNVTVQDSGLDLFVQVDEGNDHVPVFVLPPAFNADFISEIDLGFSFFAEVTVPIGELIELPDVSAIIPNGAAIFNLIPGVSDIADLTDLLGFGPAIGVDILLGAIDFDLDLGPFTPDIPGPIDDVFDLVASAFSAFTPDAITVATLDGNDSIDLTGLASTANVLAGDGNDDIIDGNGGTTLNPNMLDGGAGDDTFTTNFFKVSSSAKTIINGGAGSDTILMNLSNTDDTLNLSLDASGDLFVEFNGLTQTIEFNGVEKIQITANEGDDALIIDIANGLIPLTINWDGGDGTDSITLQGGAVASNTHFVGPFASGTGTVALSGGGNDMTLNYEGMDPVAAAITDLLSGPLTVQSTPNANAINVGPGANGTTLVEVDSDLFLNFANKTSLTLNAGSGADIVDLQLGAEAGFSGGTQLTVNGDSGADVITAEEGLEALLTIMLNGGSGNDQLFADAVLNGGPGDDVLVGGDGGDTLNGGDGDDILDGRLSLGNTLNSYDGGPGDDTILVTGTVGVDTISGVQGTNSTILWSINGSANRFDVFANVEQFLIEAKGGDDAITLTLAENLTLSTRFIVDGGPNHGADVLTFVDNGPGDRILLRQGSDDSSGTIYPDALGPIVFQGIEDINFSPLNPITGGTGVDGGGRVIVLDRDPFEFNDSLFNATDVGALASEPHNPTIDLPGDEDWYRFRAPKIGTFSFEILFERLATLPGAGEIQASVYREDGTLIANSVDFADGDVVSFSADRLEDYFLRVRGVSTSVLNVYDVGLTEVDLVGPQVYDPDGAGPQQAIQITGSPEFNLFDVKPTGGAGTQGPTPPVFSLTINLRDILNRSDNLPDDLSNRPVPNGRAPGDLYPALDAFVAGQLGHFEVRGDHNGIIPIASINVVNDAPVAGQIATAQVRLNFAEPLPDDRFTLKIFDTLIDPAGNAFDGNSNAAEPQGGPTFPTGDNVAGGDFAARFTVDSRAEIGVWAAGAVHVDTNGNFLFDPENADNTNEDIGYVLGFTSDSIFAGNFASVAGSFDNAAASADGYDKLAAYGLVAGNYRWLIDTNNNGVPDVIGNNAARVNGEPVAGDLDDDAANGDELALKAGNVWHFDLNRDLTTEIQLSGNLVGRPIIGDFDGDGLDDLGAWADDTFRLDLSSQGVRAASLPAAFIPGALLNGSTDVSFRFGFPGVREIPVAADMNADGLDDIGLWTPDLAAVAPEEAGQWYFLLSGIEQPVVNRIVANPQAIGGNIIDFTPEPFGNDLFAQFGDDFALPVVGNFDPPVSNEPTPQYEFVSFQNPNDPLDVNNDGFNSPIDALWVINVLIDEGALQLPLMRAETSGAGPFVDSTGDYHVAPDDALAVINFLNSQVALGAGEGEDAIAAERSTAAAPTLSIDAPPLLPTDAGEGKAIDAGSVQIAADALLAHRSTGVTRRVEADWAPGTAAAPGATDSDGPESEVEDLLESLAADVYVAWTK